MRMRFAKKKAIILMGLALLVLFVAYFIVFGIQVISIPGKVPDKDSVVQNEYLFDQISVEMDYIVDAMYTDESSNAHSWKFLQEDDDVYGALNNKRAMPILNPAIAGRVRPGESAMAMVGMMQGAAYLAANGRDISRYGAAIDDFFLTWMLAHGQGQNVDSDDPDFGAFMDEVSYSMTGEFEEKGTLLWKTDVTAQMMIANWKYYEYDMSIGQTTKAGAWITDAWPVQQKAADYLVRMHDNTPAGTIHLLPGNSSEKEYGTWIHVASNAVPALRSASAWAKKMNAPYADYDRVADDLIIGIASMRDMSRPGYFKYRPYLGEGVYGEPTYGDSIDQLTFSPYETGAVPVDDFAKKVSDWWTNGDAEIRMTQETVNPSDWRYFGTHWHYYFDGKDENAYLYPGPGFQLGKVEWKYGEKFNDPVYVTRSNNRLVWAKSTSFSSLWWHATGQSEAGISNGFQDWRDSANYTHTAETWARFVDTSGYFIEVALMHGAGIDTTYAPVLQ